MIPVEFGDQLENIAEHVADEKFTQDEKVALVQVALDKLRDIAERFEDQSIHATAYKNLVETLELRKRNFEYLAYSNSNEPTYALACAAMADELTKVLRESKAWLEERL